MHRLLLLTPAATLSTGERLLAVLVGETKDSGQNMHKFVLTPPGGLSLAGCAWLRVGTLSRSVWAICTRASIQIQGCIGAAAFAAQWF